jgi:hypothetical protein
MVWSSLLIVRVAAPSTLSSFAFQTVLATRAPPQTKAQTRPNPTLRPLTRVCPSATRISSLAVLWTRA